MTHAVQELIRKHDSELLNHPDVKAAVAELVGIIRNSYPDAHFDVGIGHEPLGVYITATVDVEDTDEVRNLFLDRIMELQVDERIPVYVLTESPPERWMHDVPAADRAGTLAGAH